MLPNPNIVVRLRALLDCAVVLVRRLAGPLAVIATVCGSHAQERFDILRAGRNSYTNAVVTGKTATNISITHAQGHATLKVTDLDSPTLARLGISSPPKATASPQAAPARPNLVMKGRDSHPTIPNPSAEKFANQLIVGTGVFVGGFFFICNIIRPIVNGFLFHVGYFIFFGTGVTLGGFLQSLREHRMAEWTNSWVVTSLIALLNVLALIALFRIAARMFAARSAGVRQEASVRALRLGIPRQLGLRPVAYIISLTDFVQFGVYSGCYALGPVIVLACGK